MDEIALVQAAVQALNLDKPVLSCRRLGNGAVQLWLYGEAAPRLWVPPVKKKPDPRSRVKAHG